MLDIKYIKENPEEVIARLAKKGKDARAEIEEILKLDGERRALIAGNEAMKAEALKEKEEHEQAIVALKSRQEERSVCDVCVSDPQERRDQGAEYHAVGEGQGEEPDDVSLLLRAEASAQEERGPCGEPAVSSVRLHGLLHADARELPLPPEQQPGTLRVESVGSPHM